jgi:5-formyltetrahydrofolate cyclo-ligase
VRKVDLVLVPGVAFDRQGHRLGHGLGYFDRFLSRVPKTTPTVGLAFRFQLLDRLPAASHDRAVQTVLTA